MDAAVSLILPTIGILANRAATRTRTRTRALGERGRAYFSIKQVSPLPLAECGCCVQPRIGINDTPADSLPLVGCILRDLCVKLRRTACMQNSKPPPPPPPPSSTSRAAGPTGFYLYTLSARETLQTDARSTSVAARLSPCQFKFATSCTSHEY